MYEDTSHNLQTLQTKTQAVIGEHGEAELTKNNVGNN